MQKSNWIIIAILVAASVLFLWMWQALQFNVVDNPVDLVITLAWWLVIAGACVAIHLAEKKRRERIRTMFLAPGLVYNCETGVIRLEPGTSVVDTLQTLLGGLELQLRPGRTPFEFPREIPADRANVEVRR